MGVNLRALLLQVSTPTLALALHGGGDGSCGISPVCKILKPVQCATLIAFCDMSLLLCAPSPFQGGRLGWGCTPKLLHDHFKHSVQIFQYFVVPETYYLPALLVQISASVFIVSFLILMLSAIQLNHQFSFHTRKVHDICVYRMLASEAAASDLLSLQFHPEPALNIGHVGAQRSCSCSSYRRNPFPVRHRYLPSAHTPAPSQGKVGMGVNLRDAALMVSTPHPDPPP